MNISSSYYTVNTSQGQIALWDSKGKGSTFVFLHGNSACYLAWQKQYESKLAQQHRFVALDLPGHGKSARPRDKQNTYTYQGYAAVVEEVVGALGLHKPIVVAWSLGAIVAYAMLARGFPMAGLIITGAAPIPLNNEGKMDVDRAFIPNPQRLTLLTKEQLNRSEATEFVITSGFDPEKAPFMLEAALATDGKARSLIIQNRNESRGCCDCKTLAETSDIPLCIVEGQEDKRINFSYLQKEVKYKNLFGIFVVEKAGHAAFWDQPDTFNNILSDFINYATTTLTDASTARNFVQT